MVRKRPLTLEEKLLWKHITRHDKPLIIGSGSEDEIEEYIEITQPEYMAKSKNIKSPAIDKPHNFPHKEKKLGDYAGIDKNTAERFRKGDSPIDAAIDLHGMTRENAYNALIAFIGQQMRLESRRLLVITGKGSGILRTSLPDWLSAPNLSGAILAFDVAKPKHGGTGAYYILLKRKRNVKNKD
ncbi:MAG: Smr/MutS family protein [Rickettsiales bacterium]|jgi:DNA-nicking Smr family endonuclease